MNKKEYIKRKSELAVEANRGFCGHVCPRCKGKGNKYYPLDKSSKLAVIQAKRYGGPICDNCLEAIVDEITLSALDQMRKFVDKKLYAIPDIFPFIPDHISPDQFSRSFKRLVESETIDYLGDIKSI